MSDHELPLDWVDPELSGSIETVELDIDQPSPGVIEGQAVLLRRDDTGDTLDLRINGNLEESVTVDPSPIYRTGVESWHGLTRAEVPIEARPGIGTFTVTFGDESQEITLLKSLPQRYDVYHDNPNGDSVVGLDAQDRPAIRIGSNTDMFTTVNTFDAIYVDDGFEDRKRVTAKVLPMDGYPGVQPENGYDFARQGIIVRNTIPNGQGDSGYVHLFHSPTLGEVRLQADFTGDGFTAYNDPSDGIFSASPIAADPPLWLRLERTGGTVRSYVSTTDSDTPPPDSEWQLHRTETLPNVRPIQDVGMYGSHNNSAQVTATFDSFQRLDSLGQQWRQYHSDSAGTALTGRHPDGSIAIVTGEGTDLWETTNEFSAVYQPGVIKDGDAIQARVLPVEDYQYEASGYEFARAGLMIRNSIPNDGTDSGYVHLFYSPTLDEVRLQADFTGDGLTTYNSPNDGIFNASPISVDRPCWLRLERSGGRFTSYVSGHDGDQPPSESDWQQHRSEDLPDVATVQDAGVYASHNDRHRVTARFDNVSAGDDT